MAARGLSQSAQSAADWYHYVVDSPDRAPSGQARPVRPAPAPGRYPDAVEEVLATLPTEPGCYIFKNAAAKVLYVGKARVLRDRVRSYFRSPNGLTAEKRDLVRQIATIDYQLVGSDTEALLLEFNLIKLHRPKYNIRLKDDASYLSIKITNDPYPRIETVRRRFNDGARYFGPYPDSKSVYGTLKLLKRLFPYRSCMLNILPPEADRGAEVGREASLPVTPIILRRGRSARRRGAVGDESGGEPPKERIRTVASPTNRACLEYHMHRCAAPCIDAISQQDYTGVIDQASLFLEGRTGQMIAELERHIAQLEREMEEASDALDFETAAQRRDQIAPLSRQIVAVRRVTERQRIIGPGDNNQDVVGLARAEDEACVELLAVRGGRMLGHKQFLLQGTAEQEDGAVLAAFLTQFYLADAEVPEELLLPVEPDEAEGIAGLLSERRGRKVVLTVPKRGDKLAVLEIAHKNALDAAELRRRRALTDNQKATQALNELQEALSLPRLPMRIECYDISTFQGTSTVGSMVVFEGGKPKTAAYRRFRIKTVVGTDDFASLAEMTRRRLKRAEADADSGTSGQTGEVAGAAGYDGAEGWGGTQPGNPGTHPASGEATDDEQLGAVGGDEEDASTVPEQGGGGAEWTRRPDLMIIDGGKGQLGAVLAVLRELGIDDQPIVSLAKQHEEIFVPGRPASIILPRDSQALFLVQRIRDEAHRFAITYHRNVRGKRSLESSLDAVPGVGGGRKRDLLRHFGSAASLRRATLEEIAAVPGIGPKIALTIKEHLGDA